MSRNTKQTSARIATLASETLLGSGSSDVARRLAASALAQRHTGKQTGAEMEHIAGQVMRSDKYSHETKELAATVLAQANRARKFGG